MCSGEFLRYETSTISRRSLPEADGWVLFDEDRFGGAAVYGILDRVFELRRHVGLNNIGYFVSHAKYIGNVIGTETASGTKFRINSDLH